MMEEGEKRKERKKKRAQAFLMLIIARKTGVKTFSGCCSSVATPGRETILQALVVGVRVARGLDK